MRENAVWSKMDYCRAWRGRKPCRACRAGDPMEALAPDSERLIVERDHQRQHGAVCIVTDHDISSVEDFSHRVRPLLGTADFKTRRQLIEALDWQFTLLEHDGQYDVTIHWFG